MLKRLTRWKVNNPGRLPDSVKSAIMLGLRATSFIRLLPDFIIIGGQRCGTTSLFNYLAQHPNVFPSYRKEVHYFDANYDKGLQWYRAHFPSHLARQVSRWRGRIHLTGEASPLYLFDPRVPERVRRDLPGVKLIALLRDPVSRAHSHYHKARKFGHETLDFEEALDREADRLSAERERMAADPDYVGPSHIHHSYTTRGIYLGQIKRWHELFGRDQLLVLRSEDLFTRPGETFDQALRFLGLPPWRPPAFRTFNAVGYSPMPAHIEVRLRAFFAPHNAALAEHLGRDMGWDDQPGSSG